MLRGNHIDLLLFKVVVYIYIRVSTLSKEF